MVKSEISKWKRECLSVTDQDDVCAELLSLTPAEASFTCIFSLGSKCARSSFIFLLFQR